MPLRDLTDSLTPEARQIYDLLVEKAEGYTGTTSHDAAWWSVYLDNARPSNMNQATFRAYLSVLSKAGLYDSDDRFATGYVLTDKTLTLTPSP